MDQGLRCEQNDLLKGERSHIYNPVSKGSAVAQLEAQSWPSHRVSYLWCNQEPMTKVPQVYKIWEAETEGLNQYNVVTSVTMLTGIMTGSTEYKGIKKEREAGILTPFILCFPAMCHAMLPPFSSSFLCTCCSSVY